MSAIYPHLEVLGPRIVARPLRELDVTAGGIIRVDTAKVPQNRAVVEKVGPGELIENRIAGYLNVNEPRADRPNVSVPIATHRPLTVQVGDVVFYQKFAGAWIVLDERERLMLMEDEIQARLPAGKVPLVEHGEDGKNDHLEGEPCLLCMKPAEDEARASLAAMRAELVSSVPSSVSGNLSSLADGMIPGVTHDIDGEKWSG